MEKKLFSPVVLVNLILSVALTFISYLYAIFQLSDTAKLKDFFISGKPFLINYVTSSTALKYIPLLPVLMAWFFIGALAYFVFYALVGVYSFAYNKLQMASYVKSEVKEDFHLEIKPFERVAVHLIAICSFAFGLTLFSVLLLPLSETIYQLVDSFTRTNPQGILPVALPFLALFAYWVVLAAVIQTAWHYIKKLEDYETFRTERESF